MLNFFMGNGSSAQKINFEDLQEAISSKNVLIISTLPTTKQNVLVFNTLNPADETREINHWMKTPPAAPLIIVYGENSCDDTAGKKYLQLVQLGFKKVAIYPGGLFEWLLLQDIYGTELFPTIGNAHDMLKYKGISKKHALNHG